MPRFWLATNWKQWLTESTFYGNSVAQWLMALGVFLLAVVLGFLANWMLSRRVGKFAEFTRSDWDDAVVATLERTKWWFVVVLAAFCGSLFLTLPDKTKEIVQTVAILTLLLQAALWGNVLIGALVSRHVKKRMQEDPGSVMMVSALAFVGKLILFSLLLLLALDNMDIDVTALIAGLGVGGIAVALAVQNILGDLLASFSIIFDKPFVLGDFIIVGEQMGTVEKLGIKTTRVRSLSGEQLVFANNDLLASRIRNFKRMQERRIVFSVGVTYETPREKLQQLPQLLKEIVESQQQVRFDRAHFKSFGDFALVFEVVYYTLVPDYNLYMDIQQSINLAIYQQFAQLEVDFAYPTQTLYLQRSES